MTLQTSECQSIRVLVEWAEQYEISQISNTARDNSEAALLNITELDLSYKKIDYFSESLLKMTGLKKLDMRFMALDTLPEIITEMTWLESLDLSHNQLYDLPDKMIGMTSLKTLDISWNHILELPGFLSHVPEIRHAWNR